MELDEIFLDNVTAAQSNPFITEEEERYIYEQCNGDAVKASAMIMQLQQQRQADYINEHGLTSESKGGFSK